jgi:aldehyde:ferredoxin oxidoreductase
LHKIARREGCGAWLAEGVMRASARIGGEAPDIGVYTLKGASPRGHDHRARWEELLDTCLSNTSTIEATPSLLGDSPGSPKLKATFSPEVIVEANVASGGWRQFVDCLGVCRFCLADYVASMDAFNAITGWQFDTQDALDVGQRVINQLRVFNYRHGLDPELEAPSPRYQSTPIEGPGAGKSFREHFDRMKRAYWKRMGWDTETGKPLPGTLKRLGLADLIPELWSESMDLEK